MLDDNVKDQLGKYKEIHSLSQIDKCSVSLVINTELNQIAVRKDITGKKADIYNRLKDIDNIHLPKILLLIEEEDHITVVEEYIEGKTLQDILMSADAVEEVKLLDIIQQLCEVVDLLHNLPKPIIHRDIKPSNIIMSSSGILKLIDFDASREYKSDASKDTINLGTIEYAAPEQFGYSQTDIRSDIYAVGMLILEFIKKADTQSYIYRHRASFKRIIDKCTMFDPNQRFQNINELLKETEGINGKRKTRQRITFMSFSFVLLTMITVLIISLHNKKDSNGTDINADHSITIDDNDGITSNQDNYEILDDSLLSENDGSANEINQNDTSKDVIRNEDDLSINEGMINSDIEVEYQGIPSEDIMETSSNKLETNSNSKNSQEEPHYSADTNQIRSTEEAQLNTSNNKESSQKNNDIAKSEAPDETVTADNSASNNDQAENAIVANYFIDYYKNPKYREDLKIYVNYNSASKVEYLSIIQYGRIEPTNYIVEGNIVTLKKEYLDTLPSAYYTLYIGVDVGVAAEMQFQVHDESEDSPFGYYRLSHYYREFYTSGPEDLTYLVYNIKNARIKALWNDTAEIDASYYQIEDNGYVVTLFKEYMMHMKEGTICKLNFVFDNGEIRTANFKLQNKPIKQPVFHSAENTFYKSSPEDVSFKVIWNDAIEITSITPQTEQTLALSPSDYRWEEDVFVINKEVLQKLPVGQYKWMFLFDTGFGNILTINILR